MGGYNIAPRQPGWNPNGPWSGGPPYVNCITGEARVDEGRTCWCCHFALCFPFPGGILRISENRARQNVSAVLVQTSPSPPDGWFESEGMPIKAVRSLNISIHF